MTGEAPPAGTGGILGSPRIAMFQASWPLQCHAVNLAEALADSGYHVDVFLFDVDHSFVDSRSGAHPQLTIHEWARRRSPKDDGEREVAARTGIKKMLRKIPVLRSLPARAKRRSGELREWCLLFLRSRRGLIPRSVISETAAFVESSSPVALVGVERRGLIWASEISRKTGVPFAYYNLELYTRDHPNSNYSVQAKRAKRLEARAHHAAAATIIQDEHRARVLLADNGIANTQLAFLPVSVPGPPDPTRTRFLHEHLGLHTGDRVVLQLGGIRKERLSLELAEIAQSFPPACLLVMHGEGTPSMLQAVVEANANERVVLSTQLVSDAQLLELIASADVGLVLYGSTNENDILTARSSEKLALFLRAGVPIVAFAYPGYEVIRDYKCGVLIGDLRELPSAVETILAEREDFSRSAVRCFADHYDFNELVKPVIHTLGHLGGEQT
jgi:glycosyltransferase involved in cell wall biosynthesis